jgi:translation initiation factor IF-1
MEPVRNAKGGKGYKKRKTNRVRVQPKQDYSNNVEEGEGYFATVRRILGGNQVEVMLSNGTIETVAIPGRMRKGRRGGWIKQNMLVNVNTENEILNIIKDADKNSVAAHTMMDKVAAAKSGFCFYEDDSSSDDDDELNNMVKSEAADNGQRNKKGNETDHERELREAREKKKKEYGNSLWERENADDQVNKRPCVTIKKNNSENEESEDNEDNKESEDDEDDEDDEDEESEDEENDKDDDIQYVSKSTGNSKFSRQKQNMRGHDFNIDDI